MRRDGQPLLSAHTVETTMTPLSFSSTETYMCFEKMDEALGAYAHDFLNLPRTITAKRLLTTLQEMGLHRLTTTWFQGRDQGPGYNGSILRVGFMNKQLRHRAVLQLSEQIFPTLHRAPLRVSLACDIPKGHCLKCGRKGHSARDTNKCTPTSPRWWTVYQWTTNASTSKRIPIP